ncbi:YfgM family protein [Candidatus Fukatsuia anoeciicola]|uniref:YfgM family protein n=1 Tax=Candidatus Fukatsuia anoeciicola TaxID=2994492 RepID=UPI003464A263
MKIYANINNQANTACYLFSKNIRMLIVSIVLSISILIGWYYWQNYQNKILETSSFSYQELSEIFFSYDKDLSNKKLINKDNYIATAEKFIQNNNSNYSIFVALELTNYFIRQKIFDKAEQYLILATSQTKDKNLLSLINLRLARLQLHLKKLDTALKTLNKIQDKGWIAIAENIRGDLLLGKGDIIAARAAYIKAIKYNTSQALQMLLYLKLDNLSN